MSKTPKRNLTMLSVEKGQLLKIGTSGEEVKGIVMEVDAETVRLAYNEQLIEVPMSKVESVRTYHPPSDVAMALLVSLVALGLVGIGVLIGNAVWG